MKKATKILLTAILMLLSTSSFAQSQKHVVQAGETIFGIARKYNVNANDIIQANPSVGNGDKIVVGQTLTIPGRNAANAAPANSTQRGYLNTGYKELYRIQKKDNLYRIATLYGLTIEELVAANPGLTVDSKLKKDEFLYIPFSKAEKQAEAQRVAEEKAKEEKARIEAAKKTSMKRLKVAVILPLKEAGDRGQKMVEFYRGILMAADSLKTLGTTVNMYAYHSGTTMEDAKAIVEKPEMAEMDIIFGPLNTAQATVLNDFCQLNKIRLVMPFTTTNTVGTDNPYTYQASINSETARKNGADVVANHFNNANFIMMQTGTADDRGTRFCSELKSQLALKGQTMKTLLPTATDQELQAALSPTKRNIIIPDASSLSATGKLAKRLRAFQTDHAQYALSLVGYPEWPTYVNTMLMDFYALDTYAYCTFYRNPTDARVQDFEAKYKANFKKEISHTYPRYGIFGFDLAFYFMNGLSKLGDNFDEKINTLRHYPLQNSFFFDQKNEKSAHINQEVDLVHYTPSQRIEVIK